MDEGLWENLKSACSGGSPAGVNCEYQPAFLELMQLAAPRQELQMGSAIIAARLPDWPAMLQQSSDLAQQTRDLRIGVVLTESLAQLNGWSGLADGLEILAHWTTQLWSEVYPELDRDEDDDPTARLSALAYLLSDGFIHRTIYQLPLAEHSALGVLRLRDTLSIYKGKHEVSRELTSGELEAFFKESAALNLAIRLRDVDRCVAALEAIDLFLNEQPGTGRWSAVRLMELLVRNRELMFKHLANHDSLVPTDAEICLPGTELTALPFSVAQANATQARTASVTLQDATKTSDAWDNQLPNRQSSGQMQVVTEETTAVGSLVIGSRHEATTAIDAVCAYFQIHEPASPVPFLLQRAKRLISMNFIELMHELAPNEAMQLLRQLHVVDKAG